MALNPVPTLPTPSDSLWIITATPHQMQGLVDELGGYESVLQSDAPAANAFKNPADTAAFLASRALLKILVAWVADGKLQRAKAVGIERHCPKCGLGTHGQPRTSGYSLSSSRTQSLVAAALAPADVALGLDLEHENSLAAAVSRTGFDQLTLNPAELRLLASSSTPDLLRLTLWTGKEAVLKAAGTGLHVDPASLDLSSAVLSTADSHSPWLRVATPRLIPPTAFLRWLELPEHQLAVAAGSPLRLKLLPFEELLQGI